VQNAYSSIFHTLRPELGAARAERTKYANAWRTMGVNTRQKWTMEVICPCYIRLVAATTILDTTTATAIVTHHPLDLQFLGHAPTT
jgi:hypothetical protein